MLDGKQITANSRQFLMSWKASREAQQIREKSKADLFNSEMDSLPSGGKWKRNNRERPVHLPSFSWLEPTSLSVWLVSLFLPHIRSNVMRSRSMIWNPAPGRYMRNAGSLVPCYSSFAFHVKHIENIRTISLCHVEITDQPLIVMTHQWHAVYCCFIIKRLLTLCLLNLD